MSSLSARSAAAIVILAACVAAGAETPVRTLEWDDLMPPDWSPLARLEELRESGRLDDIRDGTAEADAVMQEFVSAGSSAPVVQALDGSHVKLPGFVVPLDYDGTRVNSFLLVPYFGACIHVPPPPANQIVYVTTDEAYAMENMWDPVWVTGRITSQAFLNDLGDAGYTMSAQRIEPYDQ